MNLKSILSELRSEHQRINRAIAALEALDSTGAGSKISLAAQKPQKARKRGGISAAGRKRISEMMKARWAARRKAVKKG